MSSGDLAPARSVGTMPRRRVGWWCHHRVHRLLVVFMTIALVSAACGGQAETDDGPDTPASGSEPTDPTEADGPGTTIPADMTTTGSSEDPAEMPTESTATVSVGDATYAFAVLDEGGRCDPDYLGGTRASMTRVDESRNPVASSEPGGTDGITMVVAPESVGENLGLIAFHADGVNWSAGGDGNEDSSIDSVIKDGNHVEGTATFVSDGAAGPIQGTFEVTCVG